MVCVHLHLSMVNTVIRRLDIIHAAFVPINP